MSNAGATDNEDLFEQIAVALETDGWLVLPNGLPADLCTCL